MQGREPHLVGVLKGACPFMTDLAQAIELPLTLDYIAVSSYGKATKSSGEVKLVKDLDQGLDGRDLVVVEDIVDTGLTLNYLINLLKARGPRSREGGGAAVEAGAPAGERARGLRRLGAGHGDRRLCRARPRRGGHRLHARGAGSASRRGRHADRHRVPVRGCGGPDAGVHATWPEPVGGPGAGVARRPAPTGP